MKDSEALMEAFSPGLGSEKGNRNLQGFFHFVPFNFSIN